MPSSWSWIPPAQSRPRVEPPLAPPPVMLEAPLGGPQPDDPVDYDFDPGEHVIDQVQDFVLAHPEARAEILAAERDGKARSTLIAWLESDPA